MGRTNSSSKWASASASVFCAALIMMVPEVYGKRFIVGGYQGWASDVDYTIWAGNRTFYLGDWLCRNINNVIEVSKTNYETCNVEHPVHNYTTGSGRDAVPLNVTHDRYFISSKRSCLGGMKLHVHLTTPLPSPINLSPLPASVYHAPSPSWVHLAPSPSPVNSAPSQTSSVDLAPLPQPPQATPSRSHSSRFTVLISQLVIPIVVAIAAIHDLLLVRVI
ncbi:hypothetical protein QVD17_09797 [Tagetes erecta]|uniref:Phytocyanin domain-containing protein n=1 Tax=Tagetes erecta TaxID=13708 RepID=A0AAD8L828_TARER|nr:hypothetical protein QVD17_09797 [Tagetes erecta]